jgi:hypothetical protein
MIVTMITHFLHSRIPAEYKTNINSQVMREFNDKKRFSKQNANVRQDTRLASDESQLHLQSPAKGESDRVFFKKSESAGKLFISYLVDDIKFHHSFASLFFYQSIFSPSHIRSTMFFTKVTIQSALLEAFMTTFPNSLTSGGGTVAVALLAAVLGNATSYVMAVFLKSPKSDLIKFKHCPPTKWDSLKQEFEKAALKKFLMATVFTVVFQVLNSFFNMVMEQAIGTINYRNFAQSMAICVALDLGLLGILPSFVGATCHAIGASGMGTLKHIAQGLYKIRAFRSLRNI